jgi:methionyl-tRNA formyltransferase
VIESRDYAIRAGFFSRNPIVKSPETRILFMGTPDYAVPSLTALAGRYTIVGVITQPDRPAGRGRRIRFSPVKTVALECDLPIFQPKSLRTQQALDRISSWAPDVIVTAAIGHILTADVLAIPTRGTINVHASLLPRWRGGAPIQAALLAGDKETGVTIMCTDKGMDTGPILSQRAIAVEPRETAATLHGKLAQLGAELLMEILPRWLSGDLIPQPQPASGVTRAPLVRKEDGLINWQKTARYIDRHVRAYTPWPGAYTFWGGKRIIVTEARPLPDISTDARPMWGTVILHDQCPAVVTGDGLLRLDGIQIAGKRATSGSDFVRGRPDFIGARLESPG